MAERFGDMITADHKVLNEARLGDAMDSKFFRAKPNQLKRRREISDISYVQKKTQDPFTRTILRDSFKLAKS